MSRFWRIARWMTVCAALGIGVVAGGVGISRAGAQQGTAAENGIVGVAIGLTAHTVGAPARLIVERVLPGGPAAAAGVERGDEIIAISGQAVTGKTLRDITDMIRGKVGTPITLTFARHGQNRDVTLTRAEPPPWRGTPTQPPHG
jgi:C-terminal processing protease CtpA/Prc